MKLNSAATNKNWVLFFLIEDESNQVSNQLHPESKLNTTFSINDDDDNTSEDGENESDGLTDRDVDPARTRGVDPARTRIVDPARTRVVDPARTRGVDPARTRGEEE